MKNPAATDANTATFASGIVSRMTLAGALAMYLEFYDYAIYRFLVMPSNTACIPPPRCPG